MNHSSIFCTVTKTIVQMQNMYLFAFHKTVSAINILAQWMENMHKEKILNCDKNRTWDLRVDLKFERRVVFLCVK